MARRPGTSSEASFYRTPSRPEHATPFPTTRWLTIAAHIPAESGGMAFRPPKHNADTDPVPPAAAAALFLALNRATLSRRRVIECGRGMVRSELARLTRRQRAMRQYRLEPQVSAHYQQAVGKCAGVCVSKSRAGPCAAPRCCGLALSRGRDADERWWIRKWLLARTSSPPHRTPQHTLRHPWGSSHSNLAPLSEINQPELASWLG